MSGKLREFDLSNYLEDEDSIALYLELILEEDPDLFVVALGEIARSFGMTELARKTGLARESLYQAFSESGNPTYSTIKKVLDALGLRLKVEAASTE